MLVGHCQAAALKFNTCWGQKLDDLPRFSVKFSGTDARMLMQHDLMTLESARSRSLSFAGTVTEYVSSFW